MLKVEIGNPKQTLIFTDPVIQHFSEHRQLRFWQPEAGGQLFAEIKDNLIEVVKATGPRKTDWRSRFLYLADRYAEQKEINKNFNDGLHFVGSWHTHPQSNAKPSRIDISTWYDNFKKSTHELAGIICVVVGQKVPPDGMYIAICNGINLTEIKFQ